MSRKIRMVFKGCARGNDEIELGHEWISEDDYLALTPQDKYRMNKEVLNDVIAYLDVSGWVDFEVEEDE